MGKTLCFWVWLIIPNLLHSVSPILRADADLNWPQYPGENKNQQPDALQAEWDRLASIYQPVECKPSRYELLSQAYYHLEAGNTKEAQFLAQQLSQQDQSPSTLALLAKIFFNKGDFFSLTRQPAFASPRAELDLETHLMLAAAYEILGNQEKAEEFLDFMLTQYPNNEQIVYSHLMRLIKNNHSEKALSYLDKFLEQMNARANLAPFFYLKATLILQQNNADEALAIKVINQGLELAPRHEKLLRLKFMLLEKLGHQNQMLNCLQELAQVTNDQDLRRNLIVNLYAHRHWLQARQELELLQTPNPKLQLFKAMMAIRLREHRIALQAIDSLLKVCPSNPKLLGLRAWCLSKTGQHEQACQLAWQLFQRSPKQKSRLEILTKVAEQGSQAKYISDKLLAHYNQHPEQWQIALAAINLLQKSGHYCAALNLLQSTQNLHQDKLSTAIKQKLAMLKERLVQQNETYSSQTSTKNAAPSAFLAPTKFFQQFQTFYNAPSQFIGPIKPSLFILNKTKIGNEKPLSKM